MKTFRQFVEASLLNPLPSGDSSTAKQIATTQAKLANLDRTSINQQAQELKRLNNLKLRAAKEAQTAPQQPVMEFAESDPRSSYAAKLQQSRVAAAERRNAALTAAKERSEALKQKREEDARERKMQALQDKLNQLQR